ncbi:Microsomal glutathione S-transferase 1 [Labeo rohita]|uniref:Microsomal glutathione S-transferase 1 n=1 Tax=Labeo rohita TaxID=84645 RepID=A0ABQ8MSW5_LABRO|nr:Microsomal glutathione S-transferase 1 [Labeo rohita]
MADLMNNDVFLAFCTYATIVVLKMMFMAPLTGYYRMTRKAFSNWEDTAIRQKDPEKRKKMLQTHPDVERVRRCHQNDLENIVPFVVIGLLYALTGPDLSTALLHFRVFVGSRFIHTVSYVLALPQPSRGLSWVVGMITTFSMAYRVFLAFSTYATIVVLKMMLMSFMTSYFRMTKKAFSNPEDTNLSAKASEDRKKLVRVDPDVERVRRCHLNDLENIVPFVVIGLLYALTGPDLSTALLHFRVFVGSRFVHTVAYVMAVPQPTRALAFAVGLFTTFSMAYRVLTTSLFL